MHLYSSDSSGALRPVDIRVYRASSYFHGTIQCRRYTLPASHVVRENAREAQPFARVSISHFPGYSAWGFKPREGEVPSPKYSSILTLEGANPQIESPFLVKAHRNLNPTKGEAKTGVLKYGDADLESCRLILKVVFHPPLLWRRRSCTPYFLSRLDSLLTAFMPTRLVASM